MSSSFLSFDQIFSPDHFKHKVKDISQPLLVVQHPEQNCLGVLFESENTGNLPVFAKLPALYPEYLGDPSFCHAHQITYPYIVGEMANGIATAEMVIAANRAGLMGSFGAAGLVPSVIKENLLRIKAELGNTDNWASNLIHSPNEPEIERATVELYLEMNVTRVSSSAYMDLSPHIVRYAFSGLTQDAQGNIIRKNHVLAKLSHPKVAEQFIKPAPQKMLNDLVTQGWLTAQEAQLAAKLPVAEDITVESDSGGHTDNRPFAPLFSRIKQLAHKISQEYQYSQPPRIGVAGGLGTPEAIAAAFTMGAAYVLTGSINESAIEAGVCPKAKEMLAQADIADTEMAPAADMFEVGVKLQTLKRGTMFGRRASKLYDFYKNYDSIEQFTPSDIAFLEKNIFQSPIQEAWDGTVTYFQQRDPSQIELANKNPKYKMALLFRSYLGQSSRWAIQGTPKRELDFQIWCGPAMGAFNHWVQGTPLEKAENRFVQNIAYNLLHGACIIQRAQQVRSFGVFLPADTFDAPPMLS